MKNVIPFLQDLKKNNDRDWFQANKLRYQQAKEEFEDFVAALIPKLAEIDKDLAGLAPKQCIFRIYRDIRFSHDKSPYKINMGAAITKGGRKSPFATYYVHIEPGNAFAGGGIWNPPAPVLKAMRQEVYYNAGELKKIINAPSFKQYFSELHGEKLQRPPRNFPADFPDIELLKYKNYIVGNNMDDRMVTSDDFMAQLLDIYRSLYPFNTFINRALADF